MSREPRLRVELTLTPNEPTPSDGELTGEGYARTLVAFNTFAVSANSLTTIFRKLTSAILADHRRKAGPPPMQPGMVTWPTRRRRKRR